MLNICFRYYTWVKHVENSNAASKPIQSQKLDDVERGRDKDERGLVTIFEAKDEVDEEAATVASWSASHKTSDNA